MSFRKKPEDFNLTDLFSLHERSLKLDLNCHAVGIVEEFNKENQTVKAKIAYKKTFFERRQEDYVPIQVDYPLILDAPVIVLSGGSFSLKMPIKKGDECLVLFNDRSIDTWFNSGGVQTLDSNRLHSFSDGIVLVGLRSMPRSIEGFEDNKVKLGDETHDLVLGEGEATLKMNNSLVSVKDKITIENSSQNLLSLLGELVDAISGLILVTPNGAGSVNVESKLVLTEIKTKNRRTSRMSVRAIDENNDFTFGRGRSNYKRNSNAIAQNLKTRIQSFLGDCFFDQLSGINWFNLLGNKDKNELSLAIAAVIINTNDITRMNDFSLSLDSFSRDVNINYDVETVFGRVRNSFQLNLGV